MKMNFLLDNSLYNGNSSFTSNVGNIPSNLINLNNNIFADFNIIYHINDSYKINDLKCINSKNQLLFTKFENKNQQLNLCFVDTICTASAENGQLV